MKILVTGAAGFIGSHLVDALIANHDEVYGVDNLSGGQETYIHKECRFTNLDLRNKDAVATYIQQVKPEILFHLAADATEGRSQFTPLSSSENNYLAYLYTLVPCVKHGIQKVILFSSISVYGAQTPPFSEKMEKRPEDVYGVMKSSMEDVTRILSTVHGFSYVIIRPYNVYGPRQNMSDPYRNVVAIFLNRLSQGKPYYIYGDGAQKRAFTYIYDLIPPVVKAGLSDEYKQEVFNIGSDKPHTLNELSLLILSSWFDGDVPKEFEPVYVPFRPREIVSAYCDITKARMMLGYRPSTSLTDGIRETIAWVKTQGPKLFSYIPLELENDLVPETWKHHLI